MKICYFTAYTHSWYSLFGKPHFLIFCHIYSARCCKQPSGLLHESHCCMNELTVVFKKSFWDYLSFFTWCVFLPEAAMRRWDTVVTKRWTLSVTILMDAVPFKPCSVGTKGPKVCIDPCWPTIRASQQKLRLIKPGKVFFCLFFSNLWHHHFLPENCYSLDIFCFADCFV